MGPIPGLSWADVLTVVAAFATAVYLRRPTIRGWSRW